MKITEIIIGASRTVNLGNYNSLKLDSSLTASIGESDQSQIEDIRNDLIGQVKENLAAAYKELKGK